MQTSQPPDSPQDQTRNLARRWSKAILSDGTLVLSQTMLEESVPQLAILYVGGEDLQQDKLSWWWPNKPCFELVLKKMGFRTVEEVDRNRRVLRPTGHSFDGPILHARR